MGCRFKVSLLRELPLISVSFYLSSLLNAAILPVYCNSLETQSVSADWLIKSLPDAADFFLKGWC